MTTSSPDTVRLPIGRRWSRAWFTSPLLTGAFLVVIGVPTLLAIDGSIADGGPVPPLPMLPLEPGGGPTS